ncbi:MAG: cysteine desulfurase/selenocysteine lyase [Acidimicrobiales bacterium]|jgi:cysteine desulfurase/selenocysteine lyase
MIDLERVRADTPATDELIHFNNAGSSLPPRPVVDAVKAYIDLEAASGGYEAAAQTAAADAQLYASAAQLLNCATSEVAFTVSASDAWWRAFNSIPLEAGDRIVTGRAEYIANAFGLIQAQKRGVHIDLIDDDEHGQIDLDMLADRVNQDDVKLVALTHVPTSSGLINPAAEVGALAKEAGAWFLLDACQSAGQLPLDVEAFQCDFLSLTGRKFLRGPRGTGLLYARSSRFDELQSGPFIDGRSADWTSPYEYKLQPTAQRFELFEVNYAAKRGFGVALDYALEIGLDNIADRVGPLAEALRQGLAAIDGVSIHDPGVNKCGIVTFTVEDWAPSDVQARLWTEQVNISLGGAASAQFDLGHRGIPAVARASVHYFNTEAEVQRVVELVGELNPG